MYAHLGDRKCGPLHTISVAETSRKTKEIGLLFFGYFSRFYLTWQRMSLHVLLTSKMAVRAAAVTWGQMEEKTVLQTCLICLLGWDSRDNKMSTITSTHSGSSSPSCCSVAAPRKRHKQISCWFILATLGQRNGLSTDMEDHVGWLSLINIHYVHQLRANCEHNSYKTVCGSKLDWSYKQLQLEISWWDRRASLFMVKKKRRFVSRSIKERVHQKKFTPVFKQKY